MEPLAQISEQDSPSLRERQLVESVLRKERKATAEFVSLCADWIYPFVRRRLPPDTQTAEDLTQEILLAAWQSLIHFRGEAGLKTWVLGIARHKIEDHYRKRLRELTTAEDEAAAEPAFVPEMEQQLDDQARELRIAKTLAALPEPYALALLWRYREEKTVREMAELAGKTEKAMERLLARARAKFRERWNHDQIR